MNAMATLDLIIVDVPKGLPVPTVSSPVYRDVIKDDFGGKLPSRRPPASADGFYRPRTQ
jgi:hypothetical protein